MSHEEARPPTPDWTRTDPVRAYQPPLRPLKMVSVADIEREFASALERLTGARYSVELSRVDYEEGFAGALFDRARGAIRFERLPDAESR
jgi:hypothetical protein